MAKFSCLQTNDQASLQTVFQFDWIKWNSISSADSKLDIDFGNFTVIDSNSKYTIEPTTKDNLHVSYLTIHNVTKNDVGLYSCVVCNQFGRDYSSALLSLNTSSSGPGWLSSIQYCICIWHAFCKRQGFFYSSGEMLA